jgi:hypothetical protein
VGTILTNFAATPTELIDSPTFHFARAAAYSILNIYMIKMAGVFMISTSTVAIYTGFAPRWIAILGYGLSVLCLFGSYYVSWSFLVFPLWMFLMSSCFLIEKIRSPFKVSPGVEVASSVISNRTPACLAVVWRMRANVVDVA